MNKVKQLIYISTYNFDKNDGVVRKILNQVKTFSDYGFEVEFFFVRRRKFYIHSKKDILLGESKRIKSIDFYKYMKNYLKENLFDCAYVRHTGRIDPWLLKVLKLLYNRNTTILYEFPVFPYEKTYIGKMGKIDRLVDHIFRHNLQKYVNRVVTLSKYDIIYNIPTLRMTNGICVDDIKPIQQTEDNGIIDLIAVACLFPQNGYDRIIASLGNYYLQGGDKKIVFHLVGDGVVLRKYKELAKKYSLRDQVIFYGFKSGNELDEIYEKADIALNVFALYKIDMDVSDNLKIREYLAKGLPIVSGCQVDIFDNVEVDFFCQFPNDDTPVNMKKIIHFYEELYESGESRKNIASRIRDFGYRTVDMKVTMKPIMDYLQCSDKKTV